MTCNGGDPLLVTSSFLMLLVGNSLTRDATRVGPTPEIVLASKKKVVTCVYYLSYSISAMRKTLIHEARGLIIL